MTTVADFDVDYLHPMPGVLRLLGGQPDGGGLGVGEEDLGHRVVIGGGRIRTPRPGVDRLTGSPRGDRRTGDARLVLALVGQQGPVVRVADCVEPALLYGLHPAGVVDLQPGTRGQAHGIQPHVVGEGLAAGREQHFVDLQLAYRRPATA